MSGGREALACDECKGTGIYETECPYCGDSTYDHECVFDTAQCWKCEGAGEDPAKAAAHAAGYAEAVADIRRWLVLEGKAARGERKLARFNECSRIIGVLDIGAHVGAAKRSGT